MANKIKRQLNLVYRMSRPPVSMILLLFAYIGATHGGQTLEPSWRLLLISTIVALILINASSVNDLADEKIDKINLSGSAARPLANGLARRSEMKVMAIATATLALLLSWILGPHVLMVAMSGVAFNWVYSSRPIQISHRGFLAPLFLPIAYVATPFLIGALAVGGLNQQKIILLAGIYISFMGRILLKDFRDVKGDSQFGKRTFLLRHGRFATCLLSGGFWVLGGVILALAIPALSFGLIFYLPLIIVGLRLLYKSGGIYEEQWTIWAIARIGTAIAISILVAVQLNGLPGFRQLFYEVAAGVPFVGLYWQVVSPRLRAARQPQKQPTFQIFGSVLKSRLELPVDQTW